MKKSVYVETSVVSYLTARASRDPLIAVRQQVTREWWETRKGFYDLFISQAVLDEAGRGDPGAAERRLAVLADIELVETTEQVIELAQDLIRSHALPKKAGDDALHVAFSAVHGLDFLVTWNCTHIANPDLRPAIDETIQRGGY